MYRFLLTRRWVGGFAFAVVFAVACVLLGNWQLHRYEERHARNQLVVDNYDRAPVPLTAVLATPSAALATGDTWTPVAVTGRYVEDASLLLRNRPLEGSPGFHELVPLLVTNGDASGQVLLVDRGWLPTGQDGGVPDVVPAPPAGDVDVVVRVRPAESPSDRTAPDGQTYRIDPLSPAGATADAAGVAVADVVTGVYGELGTESPAPDAAPTALPRPEIDDGPHLGYALQWVVFALVALVGFVVVVRRTAEDADLDDLDPDDLDPHDAPDDGTRPRDVVRRAPSRRARSRPSDEDVEDAEVDAAAGGPPRV